MALPSSRTPERGEPKIARRERLLAEFEALQRSIRDRNPDLTEDEWTTLADEWSRAVDEGLRRRVRLLRGEAPVADER